jgi:hypothetical protein
MQDLETGFLAFPLSTSKVHVYPGSSLHTSACFWCSLPKINLSAHKDKSLAVQAIKLSFEIILGNILFNFVHDVFLLLYMFRSGYSVSLCCSVYCLCVNVYCTTATECQPNCSGQIYNIKIPQIVNLLENFELIN